MPRGRPGYLRHATGQAFVRISGRDYYLGEFGTVASRDAYNRLMAEWIGAGSPRGWSGPKPHGKREPITVAELFEAFRQHAVEYYRDEDGKKTSEVAKIDAAISALLELHGATMADQIGPQQLRAVRDVYTHRDKAPEIDGKRPRLVSRETVNHYVRVIVRMFRWGAEHDLLAPSVYHGLKSLQPLRHGRSHAPETTGVEPVPMATIVKTLEHLSPTHRAMVRLTLLTGMRPGEVVRICGRELSPVRAEGGDVWVYRPARHKTRHHGKTRTVYLGPQAVALLRERMPADPDAPIFPSPRSGKAYTVSGYENAIERAARRADVPHWAPNQLRHNFATGVRSKATLDAAQILLGHAHARVTEIYAEAEEGRALKIIREIG